MIHLSNENQNIYALAIKDFKYPNYQCLSPSLIPLKFLRDIK